jgi:soluble lytic murein transglycosylase-like protein
MAIESKMTIEDYMKKASGRYKVIRQDLKPQKETQAASSDFNGILSTFKKPSRHLEPKATKGLSVAGYRSHPVASSFNSIPSPADSQTSSDPSRGVTAYKEAADYLLGPETQNTQPPESGTNDRTPRASQSGLSNYRGTRFPTSGNGSSQFKSSANSHTIENAIQAAAAQYQLPPKLIKGVIKAESDYDVNAVSPAGAQGLMQLMPGTARDLGVKNPFDIKQNIDGGVRYLKKMMDMFGGNVRQALSAYNAGPETVKRYNGDVPYSETRQYVNRVINHSKTII